ncbi:MAG: hypothetical protein LKJ94_03670 [Candidatus Methanomethylophilus sp.]|jgi:hypothetical protein|nr:hypothetical protein [Methanomethylophilus sp.]MCI2074790.1 hypothetical protein [Methanomethylophilus sp.]MCI2092290.1 hypothetical protein [Methanomethylophilus sp.]
MTEVVIVGCGTDGCRTARAAAADCGLSLLTIDREDADICLSDGPAEDAPGDMDGSYFRAMFIHDEDILVHLRGRTAAVVSLFVGGQTADSAALAFGQVASSAGIQVTYALAVPFRADDTRSRFEPLVERLAQSVPGCRIFVMDLDTAIREDMSGLDFAPLIDEFAVLRKHAVESIASLAGDGRYDLIFSGRFYTLGYGNGASPAFSAEGALAFPLYRTEIMGKRAVVLTDSPLDPQERETLVRRTADLTGSVPEVVEGTMQGSSGAFVFIPISFRFSEGS